LLTCTADSGLDAGAISVVLVAMVGPCPRAGSQANPEKQCCSHVHEKGLVVALVERIRGLGDQLTQEDLLVRVGGVNDETHQLLDVSKNFFSIAMAPQRIGRCGLRVPEGLCTRILSQNGLSQNGYGKTDNL
jgi:hypothetical protein